MKLIVTAVNLKSDLFTKKKKKIPNIQTLLLGCLSKTSPSLKKRYWIVVFYYLICDQAELEILSWQCIMPIEAIHNKDKKKLRNLLFLEESVVMGNYHSGKMNYQHPDMSRTNEA